MKANVVEYLGKHPDFSGKLDDYWGKLIYIKSSLPFSIKEERYEETLVGKTNSTIAHYLGDENHSINPQAVFNTLKLLIDRQRRNKIITSEIEINEALAKKGISTEQLKQVIDTAAETTHLSKNEILQHASTVFTPQEYKEIRQDYSTFLSYRANLADRAFIEAKTIIEQEYQKLTPQYDSLDDIVRQVAYNCVEQIPYYSLPVIRILTIVVVYS